MDALKPLLRAVADFVFPPSDDAHVVRTVTADELRALMNRSVPADEPYALLPYYERRVRACVHEAKFSRNIRAFELLADVLQEFLRTLPHEEYVLVPVPLSPSRFRERGYNQVTEVAKRAAAKLAHITVREDLLVRTRNTKKQTDLQKDEREANVANAFGIRDQSAAKRVLRGKRVILLDDVLTTGATMRAAKAELSRLNPASITCVALAH